MKKLLTLSLAVVLVTGQQMSGMNWNDWEHTDPNSHNKCSTSTSLPPSSTYYQQSQQKQQVTFNNHNNSSYSSYPSEHTVLSNLPNQNWPNDYSIQEAAEGLSTLRGFLGTYVACTEYVTPLAAGASTLLLTLPLGTSKKTKIGTSLAVIYAANKFGVGPKLYDKLSTWELTKKFSPHLMIVNQMKQINLGVKQLNNVKTEELQKHEAELTHFIQPEVAKLYALKKTYPSSQVYYNQTLDDDSTITRFDLVLKDWGDTLLRAKAAVNSQN